MFVLLITFFIVSVAIAAAGVVSTVINHNTIPNVLQPSSHVNTPVVTVKPSYIGDLNSYFAYGIYNGRVFVVLSIPVESSTTTV